MLCACEVPAAPKATRAPAASARSVFEVIFLILLFEGAAVFVTCGVISTTASQSLFELALARRSAYLDVVYMLLSLILKRESTEI